MHRPVFLHVLSSGTFGKGRYLGQLTHHPVQGAVRVRCSIPDLSERQVLSDGQLFEQRLGLFEVARFEPSGILDCLKGDVEGIGMWDQ